VTSLKKQLKDASEEEGKVRQLKFENSELKRNEEELKKKLERVETEGKKRSEETEKKVTTLQQESERLKKEKEEEVDKLKKQAKQKDNNNTILTLLLYVSTQPVLPQPHS